MITGSMSPPELLGLIGILTGPKARPWAIGLAGSNASNWKPRVKRLPPPPPGKPPPEKPPPEKPQPNCHGWLRKLTSHGPLPWLLSGPPTPEWNRLVPFTIDARAGGKWPRSLAVYRSNMSWAAR